MDKPIPRCVSEGSHTWSQGKCVYCGHHPAAPLPATAVELAEKFWESDPPVHVMAELITKFAAEQTRLLRETLAKSEELLTAAWNVLDLAEPNGPVVDEILAYFKKRQEQIKALAAHD